MRVFTFLVYFTEGLAWDWVNEKLYWVDACDKDIEVFDPRTGYRKVLLETGPDSDPRGIVVDPTTRYGNYLHWHNKAFMDILGQCIGHLLEVLLGLKKHQWMELQGLYFMMPT